MIGDSSLKQNQISNERERYFRATEREIERGRKRKVLELEVALKGFC